VVTPLTNFDLTDLHPCRRQVEPSWPLVWVLHMAPSWPVAPQLGVEAPQLEVEAG